MKKFKNVYVEITKACNLKCKFCPSQYNNSHKYLSFDEFKHIIDEIKDYTNGIYLHVLGEPLLHPELFDFIDYASKYLKVSLTTNGHLIKKHYLRLANSPLYVLNISLQSLIHSNNAEIEEYFKMLDLLIKERKNKLPIHLRIWNDKGDNNTSKLNNKLDELIKKYHFAEYPYVNISVAEEFDWPNITDEDNIVNCSCLGGKSQMGILVNGDITICCLDYLGHTKLGNIYESKFSDILNNELYQNVLKGWNDLRPYFDLCKKCTYRNRFKKEN
jgi:radical SAM protein with 4Fe4S-binding SPASM domain